MIRPPGPLVSVIIPCYNAADVVADALDSALAQAYRPLEIIAVDNGSTDGTLAILQQYRERYPGLLIVLAEPRRGAPAARNRGLTAAGGDLIQFLDADDVLYPEKLAKQVPLLSANPMAGFIAGTYHYQFLDGEIRAYAPLEGDDWLALLRSEMGNTVANCFRRSALEDAGGWDETCSSHQELKLMFDLLKKGHRPLFDREPQALVRRRARGQISLSDPGRYYQTGVRFRVAVRQYLRENRPDIYRSRGVVIDDLIFHFIDGLAAWDLQAAKGHLRGDLPAGYRPVARAGNFITPAGERLFRRYGISLVWRWQWLFNRACKQPLKRVLAFFGWLRYVQK